MPSSSEIGWADSSCAMLIASSTRSCSFPWCCAVLSLPTSSWRVARSLLGLTSGSIGYPIKMNSLPWGISKMWKSKNTLLHLIFKDIRGFLESSPSSRRPTFRCFREKVRGSSVAYVICQSHWPQLSDRRRLLAEHVLNSVEECSEIAIDPYDATVGFHFLCPFLAHDHSKTLNMQWAYRMNASNLEHMHLCSFSMFQALPSSNRNTRVPDRPLGG
jgi:hypothetical protein